MTKPTIPEEAPRCACGCGECVERRKRRQSERWNRFVKGHQFRDPPRGEEHFNYKGGQTTDGTYILVLRRGHPRADRRGYVKRAVLVLEAALGRPIERHEVVHHINENKTDDRPENLQAMPSKSAHTKHHGVLRRLNADPLVRRKISGDSHWNARLTSAQVVEIKRLIGTATLESIGAQFGVSGSTVWMIKEGRVWRDV